LDVAPLAPHHINFGLKLPFLWAGAGGGGPFLFISPKGASMADFLIFLFLVILFALSVGIAGGIERLMEK
jgi:hypothetical protein